MKNSLFALVLILVTITGCKKDECENVVCSNSGTCVEGGCVCAPGFGGTNCNDTCMDHFTGLNCDEQVTPKTIIVEKIVLYDHPSETPSGDTWDQGSGADIQISISNNIVTWVSPIQMDCIPSGDYTFTPDSTVAFFDVTGSTSLRVWDDDTFMAPRQLIGQYEFILYHENNDFPTVINLTSGSCLLQVFISYTW